MGDVHQPIQLMSSTNALGLAAYATSFDRSCVPPLDLVQILIEDLSHIYGLNKPDDLPGGEKYEPYFHAEDWPELQNYVTAGKRPRSIREFLYNALRLLDAGYLRSAVVEGAAALEQAIDRFCDSPAQTACTNSQFMNESISRTSRLIASTSDSKRR